MSTENQRKKARRQRFSFTCRICGRKMHQLTGILTVIVTNGLVFCPEHMREFKRRRRNGVNATELDVAWSDTLKNWCDRPSELDEETKPKFMATFFAFREKYESWLVFERSYYHFSLPYRSRPGRIIRNPQQSPRWGFRRRKAVPPLHRLSDYLAVNIQTGEIRRFVDVTTNEALDDLREIRPAPSQAELAPFWGQRKPSGIREKTREYFHR